MSSATRCSTRCQQELADADVVDEQSLLVDDVDHVQGLAVVTVRADVVEDVAHRPVLAHGDVVRRHQPADRALRVAEERHRDGSFLRRQQRQQLARRGRRELFEEHRAVVRRHVIEQRRDIFLRHRLEEGLLGVLRQVFEHLGGVLARQHAERDDLILEAELGEKRRDVAGVAIAHHVAQLRVVAGAEDRGQLVGRPGGLAYRGERLVALWSVQLLFHLRERCSDDIVMVDVRADGPRRVQPHAMNEIEIAGRERRRMRAEMIRVGTAAAVMDDEPDVERLGGRGLLPGVAEEARLFVRRERRRLADVHVRRSQAENRGDDGAEDVLRGDDEQSHRAILPFGQRRDLGQHAPLGGCRGGVAQAVGTGIHAEHPDRHHDDVSIARRLQRRRDVGERMRVADEDQHVAWTSVHLVERKLGGRQDVEDVRVFGDGHRRAVAAASREEHEQAAR